MMVEHYLQLIQILLCDQTQEHAMQLPTPIRTYFTAQAPQDGADFSAAFAPGAIVHDEGAYHHGPDQIRDWWQKAKAKDRHHAEPVDLTAQDGRTVIRARVSGDFPGSPAILTFTFSLADDRITRLEIG
jgi:hypothetical protein